LKDLNNYWWTVRVFQLSENMWHQYCQSGLFFQCSVQI